MPRDDGRVTGHAAPAVTIACAATAAVKIVRAGLGTNQHDLGAVFRHLFSFVRRKDHLSLRGARAGGQAGRKYARVCLGIYGRMQ